jgi:hypothetical protein
VFCHVPIILALAAASSIYVVPDIACTPGYKYFPY